MTTLALAVGALTLAVSPIMAQGPGGFRPSPLMLLGQESVQKELKLTADQIQKVQAAAKKQWDSFQGFQELSPEDQKKKFEESTKENEKFVAENLKPEQAMRLNQISMQRQGAGALTDEKVAKELNLTDDQKSKVKEILEDTRNQMQGLFQSGGFPPSEETRAKAQEIRNAATTKALALLTADQKTKWKEMTGEPFKGEIRIGPPGGGRFGGGGGNQKKDK
jgi:Spy/CpxP family protein refolding chaperone